jgi:glycerol-3-phosphate acyltransferase PlsY
MEPQIALLAAAVGYLLGSISFARIIVKLVAPGEEITGVELDVPGTDEKVTLSAVSGTTVSMKLGAKYGGLTAILDILKVMIPTLVFRFAFPGTPYFLITAAMGLIGHNWPLYHRFKGGRGLSAIYGGLLAVDWLGSLLMSFVGMFLGLVVLRDVVVSYMAGTWLMIPWLWIRTRDPAYVAYAVFVNVVYGVAMIPEIRVMMDRKRRGEKVDFSGAMEAMPMLRMIKKMANRVGLMKD